MIFQKTATTKILQRSLTSHNRCVYDDYIGVFDLYLSGRTRLTTLRHSDVKVGEKLANLCCHFIAANRSCPRVGVPDKPSEQ